MVSMETPCDKYTGQSTGKFQRSLRITSCSIVLVDSCERKISLKHVCDTGVHKVAKFHHNLKRQFLCDVARTSQTPIRIS
jgi:hypothetical protein